MPLRDYELVQKAKRDGWVKISVNWLLTPMTCDPVACNGRCCKSHNSVLHPSYHPDEVSKLPQELRKFLMEDGVSVEWDWKGDCALIPYCQQDSSIIPTDCRLFPLGFSKWGRLIIKKPAWTGRCPYYKTGNTPLYVSMKQCLIDVFGEKIYKQIEIACAGNNALCTVTNDNENEE